MSTQKKLNLPVLYSVDDILDMEIPDPMPGSLLMRRTYVTCVDANVYEEGITVGNVYRIEDLQTVGNIEHVCVNNDLGMMCNYPVDCFKSIEHGPFIATDEVTLLTSEGHTVDEWPVDASPYKPENFVTGKFRVTKATATHATIQLNAGRAITVPNENLKFYKRFSNKKNTFKSGDRVKLMKAHHDLMMGYMYTVRVAEGDYVYLMESDGDRYPYKLFKIWAKPSSKQVKVKKFKSRMKLADHVRYYVNRKFDHRPTPASLRKKLLEDKIIADDVSTKDIKSICDQMFSWG
jgi:hypothetical protein